MPDILWVNEKGAMTVREVDGDGNLIDLPKVEPKPGVKPEPFAGKGDHDKNGKVGGAAPALTKRGKRSL
jgi:hypothetical protein